MRFEVSYHWDANWFGRKVLPIPDLRCKMLFMQDEDSDKSRWLERCLRTLVKVVGLGGVGGGSGWMFCFLRLRLYWLV